ncbi:Tn7-like element transposition protein TnsE [Bacillus safensis]|uniref:Tn7-like element transposition protein TnsE n=1 Tax=Bacillus safensis TaxID=561879 RepID=UPI002FFE94BA
MRVLQDCPEVQSINIIQGSLKEFSETKRFVYLSDGVTERKYVIAEVKLLSEKVFNVIEVEREQKSISTFIHFAAKSENKLYKLNIILRGLVDNNGVWDKLQLNYKQIII